MNRKGGGTWEYKAVRDMTAKSAVKAVLWTTLLTAKLAAADPSAVNPSFDSPAVRSPSALTADAADG